MEQKAYFQLMQEVGLVQDSTHAMLKRRWAWGFGVVRFFLHLVNE